MAVFVGLLPRVDGVVAVAGVGLDPLHLGAPVAHHAEAGGALLEEGDPAPALGEAALVPGHGEVEEHGEVWGHRDVVHEGGLGDVHVQPVDELPRAVDDAVLQVGRLPEGEVDEAHLAGGGVHLGVGGHAAVEPTAEGLGAPGLQADRVHVVGRGRPGTTGRRSARCAR